MDPTKYLEALVNADSKIIDQLYDKELPKVTRFVMQNNGGKQDAEDIFQKALLQLTTRYVAEPFEIKSSFEAYLFTVCKNLWRRELNSKKPRVTNATHLEPVYDPEDLALSAMEQKRWDLFKACFELLSENCKAVLQLFFNKVSYADIVSRLGYNSETVARQRVFKCKAKLTELVKKDRDFKALKEL